MQPALAAWLERRVASRRRSRLAVATVGLLIGMIELLMGSPRAVLWEELRGTFPNAQWESVTRQLRALGGVVFLEKGLSLSQEFRDEIMRSGVVS